MVQLPRVTQPARNRARTQTWVCLAAKPPLSALPEAAEGSHGAWAGRTPPHFPPSKRAGTWIRLLGKTLYTWMEKKGTGNSWVPPHPHHCAGVCWVRGYGCQLQSWSPSLPQPLLGLKEACPPHTAPQYLSPPLLPPRPLLVTDPGQQPWKKLGAPCVQPPCPA